MPWQRVSQSVRVSWTFPPGMPIGPLVGGPLPTSHWAMQSDRRWRRSGDMVAHAGRHEAAKSINPARRRIEDAAKGMVRA
jgi:hypothetical protein